MGNEAQIIVDPTLNKNMSPEGVAATAAKIGDYAAKINPNLGQEERGLVREQAAESLNNMLLSLASQRSALGDKDLSGHLQIVFKNRADNDYSGLEVKFDKQGNIINMTAEKGPDVEDNFIRDNFKPGSKGADMAEDMVQRNFRVMGVEGVSAPKM